MTKTMEFLRTRYPDSPPAQDHYHELLTRYEASGLAPPNMVAEVTSGNERGFWAHVWEALLYHHLSECGFEFRPERVTKAGQRGPDFGVIHGHQTIWIEAVTASPVGIAPEHLQPPKSGEFRVLSMPHEQMLLRWTSAIKDKRDKLDAYVSGEVIPPTDPTVIAVNACRLSYWQVDDMGISQLPFAVEAVFPIGPLVVKVSRDDGKLRGPAEHSSRFTIRKPNGADVPTDSFLNPAYAGVSAVLGSTRGDLLNGGLSLSLVHNPNATVPITVGILGATKEFVAQDCGDDYELTRIA